MFEGMHERWEFRENKERVGVKREKRIKGENENEMEVLLCE